MMQRRAIIFSIMFLKNKFENDLKERFFWSTFMYGLLTKREVKMAGYWPSSFFCVFMNRDEVEVYKHAKKERGQ